MNNSGQKIKRDLMRLLPILAIVVVIGVFWWLKLVGVTLADEAFCGQEEHTHIESCYENAEECELEEHTHTSSCYSDITADVETIEDWEKTLPVHAEDAILSEKLIAVATSQLGYKESSLNFEVNSNAERLGYTRYGEWYGNPYGAWDTMFTAFCLRYAGANKVPINSGAHAMLVQWDKIGLYMPVEDYEPVAGDIVFLDKNENKRADSTAIIIEVSDKKIIAIEGDLDNQVQKAEYEIEDSAILGYGYTGFDESIMPMAGETASTQNIGQTIAYNKSMFTEGRSFVVYTKSGTSYYAFDGNGKAVKINIDSKGAITANVEDKNLLLWTFTATGASNSYNIQNNLTGKYMHAYPNNGTGVVTSGKYSSTIVSTISGVRIKSNTEYAYLSTTAGLFQMTQTQSRAAVFNFGVVEDITVWIDGTNGDLMSLGDSPKQKYTVEPGKSIKLPTEWDSPSKYSYKLQGWYDVKNGEYYMPGEEVTPSENMVLYADWFAQSYDVGEFNSYVADTVSTNSFITTRVFDYNSLFNLQSEYAEVNVNSSSHSESWYMAKNQNALYKNAKPLGFIFADYDRDGDISYPYNRDAANINGGIYENLYTDELGEALFSPSNAFDPETESGIIGKKYIGKADHLFQRDNDENSEYYGYYYYDSKLNAASYSQEDKRFYVYNYLERTSDSKKDGGAGEYSDFLPFNSPYVNTNGHDIVNYSYNGENNEYNGVDHYQYDAKYNGQGSIVDNVGTNYWFGISMDINFHLPNTPGEKDAMGNYGNQDIYGNDMQFHFSGDDDVWVFVDGKLALDIGGVHGIESGRINFSTGEIVINGETIDTLEGVEEGDHVLTMYYLERGSSQSNCAIYFNLTPRYTLCLSKEDVLTREILDGAEFSVYSNLECTLPVELWKSKKAYEEGEAATNAFTVKNGEAEIWGMEAGKSYYIKETKPPDDDEYGIANGIIRLTLNMKGVSTYEVEVIDEVDANGNKITASEGFTVHGFRIDEETQQAYLIVTNAKKSMKGITSVQAQKHWADTVDHSNDSVEVYLTVTNNDGSVNRVQKATLSEENSWSYTWGNLPKYDEYGATEIVYGVEEAYKTGYSPTIEEISDDVFKITNTLLDKETALLVEKKWDVGMATYLSYDKENVTIRLLANGEYTGRTVTLNLKNNWKDSFLGLPYEDANGDVIKYTVEEAWNDEDWETVYGEVEQSDGKVPTYNVTVTNVYRWGKGYELPDTGGPGQIIWIISGLIIMMGALTCGIILKLKSKSK